MSLISCWRCTPVRSRKTERKFLFIARGLYDKSPATRQTEIESTFKPMLQAWGITMKELPDYSKSQQKLGAKFKDIFAAAAVGWERWAINNPNYVNGL